MWDATNHKTGSSESTPPNQRAPGVSLHQSVTKPESRSELLTARRRYHGRPREACMLSGASWEEQDSPARTLWGALAELEGPETRKQDTSRQHRQRSLMASPLFVHGAKVLFWMGFTGTVLMYPSRQEGDGHGEWAGLLSHPPDRRRLAGGRCRCSKTPRTIDSSCWLVPRRPAR